MMSKSFQREWEDVYKADNWGAKYPSENLIRFIARNFYDKDRQQIRILDAGCGIGTNALFLLKEKFTVYGFDASESAICRLIERFQQEGIGKGCIENFTVQDALNIDYKEGFFDCIVDNAMLPYLDDISIVGTLKKYRKSLKKGGFFFGGGYMRFMGFMDSIPE